MCLLLLQAELFARTVASLEALDPTCGVHQLLLTREEGMAGATDLEPQLRLGGMGLERAPAGAGYGNAMEFGMDVVLHLGGPFGM